MVKLDTERLVLLSSAEVSAKAAATFVAVNRSFFDQWSTAVGDEFFTEEFWEKRLLRGVALQKQDAEYAFFVFWKDNPAEVIGRVSLTQIVRGPFQSCFIGYMTAEKHTRKGVMHEALQEIVKYAFETLKLHRIEANIVPRNIASIKLAEKLGFQFEGTSPKYLRVNGVWEDHHHYVIRNAAME